MTKSKKIIIAVVILIILLLISLSLVWIFTKEEKKEENNKKQEEVVLPKTSEDLLDSYKPITVTWEAKDKIEFEEKLNLKTGNSIKLYLYSTPKNIGTFKIKEKDGVKYIDGLEEALNKLEIKEELHHIMFVYDEKIIGYIELDFSSDEITQEEMPEEDVNEENSNTSTNNDYSYQESYSNITTKDESNNEVETTPSCTPKKFSQTYSYVYQTKEECLKNGDNAFIAVSDNIDSGVSSYGCEEIQDECGTTWYGVYFNKYVYVNDEYIIVHY